MPNKSKPKKAVGRNKAVKQTKTKAAKRLNVAAVPVIQPNPVTEYYQAITTGKITACKKITAVYKHLVEEMQDPESEYFYDAINDGHSIYVIQYKRKEDKILDILSK